MLRRELWSKRRQLFCTLTKASLISKASKCVKVNLEVDFLSIFAGNWNTSFKRIQFTFFYMTVPPFDRPLKGSPWNASKKCSVLVISSTGSYDAVCKNSKIYRNIAMGAMSKGFKLLVCGVLPKKKCEPAYTANEVAGNVMKEKISIQTFQLFALVKF